MNGFAVAELKKPGLVGRLFGRKLEENAYLTIQNLLAQRPLSELTGADVENVLSDYDLLRERATPKLLDMYAAALRHYVRDLNISDQDRNDLKRLRYVLGLDDRQAGKTEVAALRDIYRHELQKALQDEHLSASEKEKLEALGKHFGLSDELRTGIYKEAVTDVIQQAFSRAIADRSLTDQEEQRLAEMSNNLGIKITHDADTQRLIERFKLFGRIQSGEIPEIQTSVLLQRAEVCHAEFPSNLHELRTITKAIRYHGPSGRIRITKGLSWRYGSVSIDRVSREELRQIDTGTLYITNKRILFNGQNKNLNTQFKKIIHFSVYGDGLKIEKDTGRDQYFLGSGDLELLGAILEAALSKARQP